MPFCMPRARACSEFAQSRGHSMGDSPCNGGQLNDPMNSGAIILDEWYSKGLIRQVLIEGYVSPVGIEDHDRLGRIIFSGYRRAKLSERALALVLLYPTIYLYDACGRPGRPRTSSVLRTGATAFG